MSTAASTVERPDAKKNDGDDDDKLIHVFCRKCMVHPGGKTCTVYCGKTCNCPPPSPSGKPLGLPGMRCVVCVELAKTHECKDTP